MPKITNEAIETKGEDELAQGHKAFQWQNQDQSIGLLDSKAICLLVALRVSRIALRNSIHYSITKVLSLRSKFDHLILLPILFSVPKTLPHKAQNPQLGSRSSPLLMSPASSLVVTQLALHTQMLFFPYSHTSLFHLIVSVCLGSHNKVPQTGVA